MSISSIIYDSFMLPFEIWGIREVRRQLLPQAQGDVLEAGVGTGANFTFLEPGQISSYTGIDLEPESIEPPGRITSKMPFQLEKGNVEDLPFADNSFDTVLFTLVFCTVPDPIRGLSELYRVLKPGGKLIFIEHVLPRHRPLQHLFNLLTPAWKKIASGCHLNRKTLELVEAAGFRLESSRHFFSHVFVGGIAVKEEERDT